MRLSDGLDVLTGGSSGVSGEALCGAPSEVFTLTMLDSFGDGKLCCVHLVWCFVVLSD